jgi:capsid protein
MAKRSTAKQRASGVKLFGPDGQVIAWNSPWEGANESPSRSRVPGSSPQDYVHEFTSYTRTELMRKMRYLRKNSGFVREYIQILSLYSCPVSPHSLVEDGVWRREAEALYGERRRTADITGRYSGEQVQGMLSQAIDTDGEMFLVKVMDEFTGLPRVQMIEAHRVGDFGAGDTVDGIKVDKVGRHVAIRIMQSNGVSRLVPMRSVMHVFDPESPSAVRHTSPLAHAINHRLDVEELLAIEKKGVKDNLEISRIITRLAGDEADEGDLDGLLGTSEAAGESTDPRAMQRVLGGKAFLVQEGENVESFESKRPNPTFTGFIDCLDRESALGAIPIDFMNPKGMNAATVRLITARVQRIAKQRSNVILEQFLRPDWFFVIGSAIDSGELPAIKGWNKIKGGFPKQVTVDAGRNDASIRADLEMGRISPSEAFAEEGKNFAESMEQKAQDLKTIEEIAARHGLQPEQLFRFVEQAAMTMTPPSAKQAD